MAPEKHTVSEKQSLCIVLEKKRAGKRARIKHAPRCHPGKETGRSKQGGNELTALITYVTGQALGKKDWRVKGLFSFSAPIT